MSLRRDVPEVDGDRSMDMDVEEIEGGITNVVLRGRLDTAGAGAIDLKFNVIAGAKRAVVVDLSNVAFMASLGIRLLVMGAKTITRKGGKLVILSPDENVHAVLKTAGIDQLIPIMFDRSAAIEAVRR
jgi:anti-sigma B factor antagonist